MPRTLTAADRSALIRLASTMPAGSDARRSILARLSKQLTRNELEDLDSEGSLSIEVRDFNAPQEGSYRTKAKGLERVWDVVSRMKQPMYDPESGVISDGWKQTKYRVRNAAKSSSSASIMREWRSKDSAEEQREVLGRALADTYEVLQTVAMLAKRTEGADAQAVQAALRSVGSAMFDVSR